MTAEEVAAWADNHTSCQDPDVVGLDAYLEQPVEVDAQEAGAEFLDGLTDPTTTAPGSVAPVLPPSRPVYADRGVFVCFEGGEGSGKSTQSGRLASRLRAEGYDVRLTFEPGDTPVGADLRRIVLSPETGALADRTEALLYAADKAEHVETVVRPALAGGGVVITDRYVDSTLAYQGAGRALDVAEVEAVARWATGDLRPHLTVVLDLAPETGLGRFEGRDRIEAESLDFHQRVRAAFPRMAAADPDHYLVLDARADVDEIEAAVRAAVEPLLGLAAR